MKISVLALLVVSAAPAVYAADFPLVAISASELGVKTEAAAVPVPAAPARDEAQAPQDLINRFQQVSRELSAVRSDLTWVRNDIDALERRARQTIQLNSSDAFFSMDLRRMSMDMSRRFDNMQRAAADVRGLLGLAQKSADLNKLAKEMEWAARDIQMTVWPTLENAAQNLEWTVRSGRPEIVGYDAQWTAMDISRYTRQLSDQARNASYDTQALVTKTQP